MKVKSNKTHKPHLQKNKRKNREIVVSIFHTHTHNSKIILKVNFKEVFVCLQRRKKKEENKTNKKNNYFWEIKDFFYLLLGRETATLLVLNET